MKRTETYREVEQCQLNSVCLLMLDSIKRTRGPELEIRHRNRHSVEVPLHFGVHLVPGLAGSGCSFPLFPLLGLKNDFCCVVIKKISERGFLLLFFGWCWLNVKLLDCTLQVWCGTSPDDCGRLPRLPGLLLVVYSSAGELGGGDDESGEGERCERLSVESRWYGPPSHNTPQQRRLQTNPCWLL